MLRDGEEFARKHYTEMAERLGQDASWVEEKVEEMLKWRAKNQQEQQERERKEFPSKPEWLAKSS